VKNYCIVKVTEADGNSLVSGLLSLLLTNLSVVILFLLRLLKMGLFHNIFIPKVFF